MDEERVRQVLNDARGWLTEKERAYLYSEASFLNPGAVILEVGGEFGASTVALRTGAPRATIVTIDLFPDALLMQHLEELSKSGINDTLQFRGDSRYIGRLWRYPLDFLLIDGGHTYEVASSDANLFTHWVKPGMVVAFHDYHGTHPLHAEVRQAVDEWYAKHGEDFQMLANVDSIISFRRVVKQEEPSFREA
jgi:predicted O-methyltransferase YrrM